MAVAGFARPSPAGRGGRRGMNDAAVSFALGVDIGGTATKIGIVGSDGEARSIESIPTIEENFLDRLCERIASVRQSGLGGLGVAVAGFLNCGRDRLLYNPNLRWLEGYPLRDALQPRFAMPVSLEVDSNAATLAEYRFGAGRGAERFLCLTAGTGLGGGMTIAGKLMRFYGECMGDLGHVIADPDGPPCSCGGRGCAEALVSTAAIAGRSGRTVRDLISAARHGDPSAATILGEAGGWLGIAAASLSHIFFPDRIAIAGGLAEAGDLVLRSAEQAFRRTAGELARSRATLTNAALGWKATLVGSACPFLEKGA